MALFRLRTDANRRVALFWQSETNRRMAPVSLAGDKLGRGPNYPGPNYPPDRRVAPIAIAQEPKDWGVAPVGSVSGFPAESAGAELTGGTCWPDGWHLLARRVAPVGPRIGGWPQLAHSEPTGGTCWPVALVGRGQSA